MCEKRDYKINSLDDSCHRRIARFITVQLQRYAIWEKEKKDEGDESRKNAQTTIFISFGLILLHIL